MDHGDEADIRRMDVDEIYGELRRRRVNRDDLDRELGLEPKRKPLDTEVSMRSFALKVLSFLTLGLICLISYLAIESKDIPDLISGLAGSGFGGIIGILTARGTIKQESKSPPPEA